MKFRVVPLLLALVLLLSVSSMLSANAKDKVILPSWIYDFTNAGIFADIKGGSNNIVCEMSEGSHTTLTALGGDPQLPMVCPEIYVSSAKYLCIEYKTENNPKGELYISCDDGIGMDEIPESTLKWEWINDGEWHRLILYCEGWAEREDVLFTGLRFDPMRLGLVESHGETIDIRFFAFFSDEQSAKDFNLAAYQKYIAENGIVTPEGVRPPTTLWQEPEYKDIEVHPDDNTPGTLRITYSEDGKYATVCFGEGENAITYTVPNSEINLFGGYAGTDDPGRSLYDSSQVGVVTEDHKVGIFYYLWHGEHGDDSIYNMQEIIDTAGIAQVGKPSCDLLGDEGDWHFWGQPLYGYYYTDDNWVMRKHIELLTNAGVDFLCLDVTDGHSYTTNALKLMAVLHDFNRMGFDAPEVVFYTDINAEACVREIYESIYKLGFYKDTWYMLDGKPVIVAPYEANADNYFAVKLNQSPTEAPKENAWPLMDFERPQRVYNDANGLPGAISVSVAQPVGTGRFSDSVLYGDTTNLGRSFGAELSSVQSRAEYYQKLKENPHLFEQGINFQAQWDRAITADAPYVLVTGWNEWIAQRQNIQDKIGFANCCSYEFSRDTEMMQGGYFDNYYIQLAINIQRLKGAAPIIVQDARNAVNVTGSFDIWDKVLVTYTDPAKDMLTRRSYGYGGVLYLNETGNNDIVACKVTADTKNVYFYVETRNEITKPRENASWMQLFLSTGGDGWYGYDYIVNYGVKDEFSTTVARYNGTNGAYAFEEIGEINYRVKENRMMLAVPLELLGITNPNGIKFDFKWVDSQSEITTMEQFYTDGDAAPLGRLNYTFQNCIDPETAEQYVPSDPATDDTAEPGGCKSIMGTMSLLVWLIPIPFWIFAKKTTRRSRRSRS